MVNKQRKRTLFKAGAGYGNVVLNFQPDPLGDLSQLAYAFHRAGQNLYQVMFSSGGYNDYDACPIFYVYRHSLELYLKSIALIETDILAVQGVIGTRNEVNKKIEWILGDHKILRLLASLERAFNAVGWTWSNDELPTMSDLRTFIEEIEEVDANSFTFRYLVTKKGESSLKPEKQSGQKQQFIVDVPAFCHRMDSLLDALDAATTGLMEARRTLAEMAMEYHP